jgi:hypothetical protein
MSRKKNAVPLNPADFLDIAKSNPYVQKLIEDQSIRENAQTAFESGRRAMDRLSSGKNPAKMLLEDKKLQVELRAAIEAIRDATTALAAETSKKKKRKRRRGRVVLIVGAGGVVALAASEGLRSKVLDALFGAEEEFQYTPPAGSPAPESPSPVSAV